MTQPVNDSSRKGGGTAAPRLLLGDGERMLGQVGDDRLNATSETEGLFTVRLWGGKEKERPSRELTTERHFCIKSALLVVIRI